MSHVTDSSLPPSSGWIPATFKSSDLELAAVASLASAELSISNDKSSQATQPPQSSQPSIQDDDNMVDSPPSVGITKEIAVAVKKSSRQAKKTRRSTNSSEKSVFRLSTTEAYDSSSGNL